MHTEPYLLAGGRTWIWGLALALLSRGSLHSFLYEELGFDIIGDDGDHTTKSYDNWHVYLRKIFLATYLERSHEAQDEN
jgi:hypothetical protein